MKKLEPGEKVRLISEAEFNKIFSTYGSVRCGFNREMLKFLGKTTKITGARMRRSVMNNRNALYYAYNIEIDNNHYCWEERFFTKNPGLKYKFKDKFPEVKQNSSFGIAEIEDIEIEDDKIGLFTFDVRIKSADKFKFAKAGKNKITLIFNDSKVNFKINHNILNVKSFIFNDDVIRTSVVVK